MCFIAIAAVSMVTTFVSFQLLRVGLQNHATDGSTFEKEVKDPLIIIAMGTAGVECLICILSILLSCRVAKIAKEEMCQQREGMFHIKVLGQKDIVVVTKPLLDSVKDTAIWYYYVLYTVYGASFNQLMTVYQVSFTDV